MAVKLRHYPSLVTAPAVRPKAYSYVRFSTAEQAKGDSRTRQDQQARAWATRRGVELDTELTFRDEGISAFLGRNAETGALGQFLEAVREKLVPSGSWLLVESLDRISRQAPHKAARTMQDIVEAGVTVVDLSDGEREYSLETFESDKTLYLMMSIRFMRAHEESTLKSARVSSAAKRRREALASDQPLTRPFTRQLPAWIAWNDATKTYTLREDRAEIVRKLFALADAGWGQHRIARWLNTEGVETWGAGKRKATQWHRTYVHKILTSEATIGVFTPHTVVRDPMTNQKKRKPTEPINHRYPAVVDRDLFARVKARLEATAPRGRHAGTETRSLFAGVMKCARCGSTVTRVSKGDYVYLICTKAHEKAKGCVYEAVPYGDVEIGMREAAQRIFEDAPRGTSDNDQMTREIAGMDEQVSKRATAARAYSDAYAREPNEILRDRMQAAVADWQTAREALRELKARRDTYAGPYVLKRLEDLRDKLVYEPFNVAEANAALKQAAKSVVLDPTGSLAIHWHHSDAPTEDIPFRSKRGGFPVA